MSTDPTSTDPTSTDPTSTDPTNRSNLAPPRRLAWFSSLPTATDRAADFTRRILPALAERVEVVLFAFRGRIDPELERYATVRPAFENPTLWREVHACDLAVHSLDRGAESHADTFATSLLHPGVTVLHDHRLHEIVAWSWVHYQDRVDDYLDLVETEHGAIGREVAERWRRGDIPIEAVEERFPLISWIASRAHGVVALDEDTYERLEPGRDGGTIGPLGLAPRDLEPAAWVDRLLEVVDSARRRRAATAIRHFSHRAPRSLGWLSPGTREKIAQRLATDLAKLSRYAESGLDGSTDEASGVGDDVGDD